MKNILRAKVTIIGTRPILWHKFGPESMPLEKQEREGKAGNDPGEWKRSYTATADGQLYLDPSYVFACLRDGAKHTSKGRGTYQALVAATLQVADPFVLVDRFMPSEGEPPADPTQPVYIDIRGVRNPATKGRNVRYRVAASTGWRATFEILWDKTIVDRNVMTSIAHDAGKLCGLGDARSIGFGRFEVESFEIQDAEEKAA